MGITYFANRGEITTVPNFVTARTANGLRRIMLRTNTRLKGFASFYSIQWVESEKRWYAWFLEDVSDQDLRSVDGD